jgi:transposase
VAPHLTLIDEEAPQRRYPLREVFNALRWLARAGAPWRLLPNDFPPWTAVYQQWMRWNETGSFEAMVNDIRSIIRASQGRKGQPSAAVIDGRTLQSTCESGPRAGYTGDQAKDDAKAAGIELQVVRLPEAKKGFVLLPRRWVVERSFGWMARFRGLSRDFERLPQVLAGLHLVAFAMLMAPKVAAFLALGEPVIS